MTKFNQNPQDRKWDYTFAYSLLLLIPFDLLASLGMDLYLPAINDIHQSFSVSQGQMQLTLTLYMAILGLGQLLFGPLSDAIGRRRVVIAGDLVYAGSSLAMALTDSFSVFLLLRIVQALSASAVLVAAFATVRDVFADREEGVVIYAIMGSVLAAVPAVAPFIGSLIDGLWHWRGIFYTLAIFAALVGLHALLKWPETRPAQTHPFEWSRCFNIVRTKAFLGYTLAYATAMGTFFVYFSASPSILMDKLGLDKVAFSLWFGSVAIVIIITTRFVKRLVKRWGTQGTVLRGLIGMMLSGGLLYGLEWLNGLSLLGFMLPMYFIGVHIALTCAVTANGALAAFSHSAGLATALYYAIESLFLSALVSLLIWLLPSGTSLVICSYILISASLSLLFMLSIRADNK
ncbi:multidrug effflux MFS transporter [Shewanella sp. 10B]|uniref:multidrug effflux MFS transporter n=1 Tax=Shewanella sp. 10B TaxID=2943322 RepID=UPI00201ADE28|nr:multidrug effflux MFS transporter [Shewanella sp. 10B]